MNSPSHILSTPPVLNIAAYKFVPLDDLPQRRQRLRRQCVEHGLKGTILLSPEGINLFLAGAPEDIRDWVDQLRTDPLLSDIHIKESPGDDLPFKRMLVKIKREIITFGVDGIEPHRQTAPKLSPAELKQWLDEGRDCVLLDVRNDYEVAVGTFEGAVPAGIDHFRQFGPSLEKLPQELRDKPIVMFCTGGIRCEKAGPLMQQAGFAQVYQLDGGILQYFEDCGGAHYQGDCFVFDGRVAVDSQLRETGLAQCFACQAILSLEDQQSNQYVVGQSCPHCYQPPEQKRAAVIQRRQEQLDRLAEDLPGARPHVQRRPIRIPERLDGETLINCLASMFPQIDAADWERAFQESRIVEGTMPTRPGRRVRAGEQFLHLVTGFIEPDVNARIRLLWEDDAIVVVNKPAPLPVHASGRFNHNTLLGLMNQVYRPEVLRAAHRLDANTTGVMVLCRRRTIARVLQSQFESRVVDKEYLVRCCGHPAEDHFECTLPIGIREGAGRVRIGDPTGADARTEFEALERRADGSSILRARPVTGRTNQIRVHLWEMGFPIQGDPLYLPDHRLGHNETLAVDAPPMCLHAHRLAFEHPITGEPMEFTAPKPAWV